jgi:flagellar motor switch/type III secretory pathway protein FliN
MASARPWLPANAVRDDALSKALATPAELWAMRWFAAPRAVNVRMTEVKARLGLSGDCACWTDAKGSLLLAMGPTAHVPIASAMLGLQTGAHKLTTQDHALLRKLAARCARDFLLTAATVFGSGGESEPTQMREANTGFRFALSLGSASQVLELYVGEHVAVAARRRALGGPEAPARPLSSREEAVGRQPIRVGAMVGVGKLGLGDLRTLACGDVLVLDRGPRDPLALAVNGVAHPDALCTIVEDNGALHMRMNTSECGDRA